MSNLHNPKMAADVSGKPRIRGCHLDTSVNMMVRVRPYLCFLPNGLVIGKSESVDVDVSKDFQGKPTIVLTDGYQRYVTIVASVSADLTALSFKVIAGEADLDSSAVRPTRDNNAAISPSDVILGDVRLYYNQRTQDGGPGVLSDDIDMLRSEVDSNVGADSIPAEVYGPPLNVYKSVAEIIQAINDGALDYYYVRKDGASYIRFNPIDVSGCTTTQEEVPPGAKKEGAMYLINDGVDKYLAVNLGDTAPCGAGDTANKGIKKIVLTAPPAGFTCGAVCDVNCDAANDVLPCLSCDGSCESYCEQNCQTGCQVVCETSDTEQISACGGACQVGCELACQSECETACDTGCEQAVQASVCATFCENNCQTTQES